MAIALRSTSSQPESTVAVMLCAVSMFGFKSGVDVQTELVCDVLLIFL
jgi:RNase adaptor protein for sRNA GlmZ degradation